ncbi:MAG: OmpW/AlkL family protein [Rhodomicrobium sp.]
MKHFLKAAAFAALLTATGAQAADLSAPAAYSPEVAVPAWWQAGDIFVRVRGEAFIPETHTGNWNANSLPGGTLSGADLSIDTTGIPELDISYFLTKNIALEVICCVGQTTVNASGSLPGLGLSGKVGDTWFFPPTIMLQYHFDYGQFKPYLGIGGNYTWFFDESGGGLNYRGLKLDSAAGLAFQAGFDYHLTGNWFLNVDAKQLILGTDFHVDVPSLPLVRVTGHVDLDPTIVGAGIGYRFGAAPAPLK